MWTARVVLMASGLLIAACSGDSNPCACDGQGAVGPQRLPLICATAPLPRTLSEGKAVSCPTGGPNVYLRRGCGFTSIGTAASFTAYSGFTYGYDDVTEQLIAYYAFSESPYGACHASEYVYGDRRAFDACPGAMTCLLCGSPEPRAASLLVDRLLRASQSAAAASADSRAPVPISSTVDRTGSVSGFLAPSVDQPPFACDRART